MSFFHINKNRLSLEKEYGELLAPPVGVDAMIYIATYKPQYYINWPQFNATAV